MTTVLVTGGAGYIGSHMTRQLLEDGHEVVVLDNLSRGHADAVQTAAFIQGDTRDRAVLQSIFDEYTVDAVMHFAAFAYVGESMQNPRVYYDNNVTGSQVLLDAMVDAGVSRLVFSSTCATYGVPERQPIGEDVAQAPVNPYGRSKLMVETMIRDYAGSHGIQAAMLRYFNAAGCDPAGRLGERHEPETHLVPLVLAEAARVLDGGAPEETTLRVFGDDYPTPDGTCVRDYIHVDDICRAHGLALERLLDGRLTGARPYNLANGQGFSVRQVVDACRRVTAADITCRIDARRPGDPAVLVGDATRIGREMGWRPRYDRLEDIVETAWHWMRRSA